MEIKTIEDVKNWLKTNDFIAQDETGIYVTYASLKNLDQSPKIITGPYTGPPMLLDGNEYKPYKVYLENPGLEKMITTFLEKGVAGKNFDIEIYMERGEDAGNGYTNHLSDYYRGTYYGTFSMFLKTLKTGDINYSATITAGNVCWT